MAKKKKPAEGNAIIYARYSSHNQRDVSIEQQIEACRKHAAELGLTITDTYEDRAISGRTDNRPAFQRMMHDAENGRFSYVLAWKSNRMGRNMMQAMVNESRLMDCGVKVYYAEEDFDDSAAGRFALRSMMNVNQFYSDNLAEDVRRGLMDNANKCMANGRQPLGYKRGEDGKVVVDEPAAAIVREVYARVASGELFTDIARDLNRRGIKTADKGEWNKNSFHRLCSNEKYRGIYIYGDVRIEGGIPSIIDDTLWYKVQEALRVKKLKRNGRHRPGEDDYLLTGKLRCGKCGGYMIGMSGRSKTGDIHYYYACQNRRVGHTCDKKNIRRDIIEPAVAQAIKEYCLTDDAIEWIADKTIEYWEEADRNLQLDSIEGDLAAVQSSISNVMKAIEMGVVTETTRDRLIELEKQRTDLKSKLALAKEEVIHVDRKKLISSLLLFRNGDIHDRQYQEDLFNTFLISVYVYDDDDNGHLKLIFNAFGENNTVDLPINFGETGDVPVFSDREKVRASSPSVNQKPSEVRMAFSLYFRGNLVYWCQSPPLFCPNTHREETNMNETKIIFFDIDGTLIDMEKKHISPKMLETLARLQANGIKICIATGRAPMLVPRFDGVELDATLTYNGSYCYSSKEVIFSSPLLREDVHTLIRNATALGRPVALATSTRLAANGADQDLLDYFAIAKEPLSISDDFTQLADGEVFQLLMGCRKADYPRILQDTVNAKIAGWWDRAVDIIPASGGKGIGVRKTLDYFGLTPAQAMAFGDGNNDLEMLNAVGCGVAMGNASDELKAIASDTCGHVAEDGIYHYCLAHHLI